MRIADSASPVMTAVEILVIAYQALSPLEQDEVLARLQDTRLHRQAGELTQTERMLASLQRVRELVGHSPTVEEYRQAIREEIENGGPGLEPLSRVIRHFGTWRMAKEALELNESKTARRIEAMFANRRVGRVHKYTEATLRETLQRCANDLGRVPQTNEFKRWREREIEIARAEGKKGFHLPGAGPYRRRYGTWAKTLERFGFTAEQIAARLERP
jgi:DNA-directed RNA polymerase beta subunit